MSFVTFADRYPNKSCDCIQMLSHKLITRKKEAKEEEGIDGMKLVQQLIAYSEVVACRDKTHASTLLSELRANALVFGTSFQRVASYFF